MNVTQNMRSRRKSSGKVLLLGVMFGVSLVPGHVGAYRFFVDGRTDWWIAGSEYASRWAADVWGPGEALVWEVAPQSDFKVLFDSPEGVLPYVERALEAWSDLATADISWRVDGVGDAIDEETARKDRRNTISVHLLSDNGGSGWARLWFDRSAPDGVWEIFGCDVVMSPLVWAEIPEDISGEDLAAYRQSRRERSVGLFVHEFGHCLGLAHAAALSTGRRLNRVQHGWELVHPRDPAMSYGYGQEIPEGLSVDDVIGASLLRPAAGWPDTTASISGSLQQGGTGDRLRSFGVRDQVVTTRRVRGEG